MRQLLPMNMRRAVRKRNLTPEASADVARIEQALKQARNQFGQAGAFLFGDFSAADAMFAPVVTRFLTYEVALDGPCADYCRAIMALAQMKEWVAAARAEPDEIDELDAEF